MSSARPGKEEELLHLVEHAARHEVHTQRAREKDQHLGKMSLTAFSRACSSQLHLGFNLHVIVSLLVEVISMCLFLI